MPHQAEVLQLVTCSLHLSALTAPGLQLSLSHAVSNLRVGPSLGPEPLRLE